MSHPSQAPLISVIVPVYKCEAFLRTCLDSILSQTFEQFEVICVDDCTPDNSIPIVEEFMQRDARVSLIRHQRNLGLGGARNTGIKHARANFIASADSDDSMKPDMLKTLWHASENGFYDIVVCSFDRVDEDGKFISTQNAGDKSIVNDGSIDVLSTTNPSFWNKLWRKSLYIDNDIWFPEHLYYQDTATTPRILTKARNIRFIKESLYNYLVRSGSVSTTASAKHMTDYFKVFDIIVSFLQKEGLYEKHFENFLHYVDRGIAHHANLGAQEALDEISKDQYLRHLLAFKIGYIENHKLVQNKPTRELVSLLEKARTKADLLPPDGCPTLPLSIIVKTFLRPAMLERFLLSVGRYEERAGVRFSEVLVGDDSPERDQVANARAIKKARDLYPFLNVIHCTYEENIGLSDGRNRLVQAARENFILLCDDDFILDDEADINAALNIAKEGEYQIIGGWLKNKYNVKTGSFISRCMVGIFSETPDELIINVSEHQIYKDAITPSEYLLNFFIADRFTLLTSPWDEGLKVEEHQEFFYRFKHSGFRAALFGGLYAKHTADRSDNPTRYNEYRFGKDNWEHYLFSAVHKMGKKRRTINRCSFNDFERWVVDAEARTTVQTFVPLREPVLAQAVPVTRVSPAFQQHFGGYYDIPLASEDGRYFLCQTAPATDRLPFPNDAADIVLIDRHENNAPRVIGSTTAWCHQQGAHAQFVPGSDNRVIYNVFDDTEGLFASCLVDVETGEARRYSRPISAVSPDGAIAASLNFSRLYDYRPGYGYPHVPDPFAEDNAPENDGLWLLNLESGDYELILAYDALRDFIVAEGFPEVAEEKLILNHVAFNTDGSKILVLLRYFSADAPFPTFTIVCDRDGSNLRRIFGFCSHYHWKDTNTLVVSGGEGMTRKTVGQLKVFEIDIDTGKFDQIGPGILYDDGHCSYSPDREFILYDSYSNNVFPYRRLIIYRLADGKMIDLGFFFSPGKWFKNHTDLRTDLHPRWSPDGKTITFDSIHEGYRGVYAISFEDALSALDSPINRFSKQDLMKWYTAKYGSPASAKTAKNSDSAIKNLAQSGSDVWHDIDRSWLRSLVLQRRADQSIFTLKGIPKVNETTSLHELARIVQKFGIDIPAPANFDELKYLGQNPDVARAVNDKEFRSGYEHYILHGQDEGRARTTLI